MQEALTERLKEQQVCLVCSVERGDFAWCAQLRGRSIALNTQFYKALEYLPSRAGPTRGA